MSRINSMAMKWWKGEAGRQFLWLPALFAFGCLLYYALPTEPPRWGLPSLAAGLCVFYAWRARRWESARLVMLALAILAVGAAWANIHAGLQEKSVVTREITPRPVSGVLEDIERVENGLRFTLLDASIRGLDGERTPERVRLSIRQRAADATPLPRIGDRVELMAGLLPPMGPATPGGFDFARYFFFRGIGAVGYGLPPWKVVETTPVRGFAQWRFELTERIIAQLGPRHGPIAAGLITGEDRAIAEEDFKDLRASNLYHIIAISGGHMVVIAGVIFIGLRLLFLLLPRQLGLRPQAKSVAAGVTLIMVTAYLFVTGMPISAVRAYVMIALVLLAVLLRREVDAMRSLALAVLIMLAIDPSDVLEPGFQLSFVATMAIIALVEAQWLQPGMPEERSRAGVVFKAIGTMFMISLVAEAATAPLVLSMFNTVAPYGVLANMLATPLVAFVIMPTVALFFLLLPFGLEGFALMLMDIGIGLMMDIARFISSLPNAQLFAHGLPGWGVALFAVGLIMACVLRQRARWVGVAFMVLGMASHVTVRMPEMLLGPELKQVAAKMPDGYRLLRGKPDSMVPQLWANALGHEELEPQKPGTDGWRCDKFGCVVMLGEKKIALANDALAVVEDCAQSDLVFTTLRMRRCKADLVNGWALQQGGVHAIWADGRMETSADWQGDRPWSGR